MSKFEIHTVEYDDKANKATLKPFEFSLRKWPLLDIAVLLSISKKIEQLIRRIYPCRNDGNHCVLLLPYIENLGILEQLHR